MVGNSGVKRIPDSNTGFARHADYFESDPGFLARETCNPCPPTFLSPISRLVRLLRSYLKVFAAEKYPV